MRRVLALSLGLALAALEASAADLYRWIDPDGREAIGTVPPPGVQAVPWTPGATDARPAPAPAAPAPAAAPAAPATLPPAARAAREREERCQRQLERANARRVELRERRAEVDALEAKLAELEASEVAYSRTDCVDAYRRSDIECTSEVFDRDKEIARLEGSLAKAREKLDDLELGPRNVPDPDCE
jgi:hypothetical protein